MNIDKFVSICVNTLNVQLMNTQFAHPMSVGALRRGVECGRGQNRNIDGDLVRDNYLLVMLKVHVIDSKRANFAHVQ